MASHKAVHPDAGTFLVVGPQCWGSGDTVASAYANAAKAGFRPVKKLKNEYHYVVEFVESDASFTISGMGQAQWNIKEATSLGDWDYNA